MFLIDKVLGSQLRLRNFLTFSVAAGRSLRAFKILIIFFLFEIVRSILIISYSCHVFSRKKLWKLKRLFVG